MDDARSTAIKWLNFAGGVRLAQCVSAMMTKRALAVGCLLGGIISAHLEGEARACSPPQSAPDGTLMGMTFQGSDYTTPKNIGLILSAFAGPHTGESGVIAQAKIDVKSVAAGAVAIPGALRRLEAQDNNTYAEYSIWAWAPSDGSQLAPGKYAVAISFAGKDAADEREPAKFEFNVDDRTLDVPRPEMTNMEATRSLEPDPAAAPIQCKMTPVPEPCGGGVGSGSSSETRSIPSRQRGAPRLNWQNVIPNPRDFAFVRTSARVFARTTSGIIVKEEKRTGISLQGTAILTKSDEYCVETTSWLLTNPDSKQVVERCTPHGSLNLSISDAEQTTYAERVVQSCSRDAPVLFPPGHTKDDPAGVGTGTGVNASPPTESSGDSGCSTSSSSTSISNQSSSRAGFAVLAGALALLILKRRKESARPR
jgi:hypothetical protein